MEKMCERYKWTPSQYLEQNEFTLQMFEEINQLESLKQKKDGQRK